LQRLVNELEIEIRVAHYPSYCSKYNPIERRFFPHVTRACQGMLFDTLDTVVGLMRKASTTTGLQTTVNVIRRVYEIGRKVADDFKNRHAHRLRQFAAKMELYRPSPIITTVIYSLILSRFFLPAFGFPLARLRKGFRPSGKPPSHQYIPPIPKSKRFRS
jgi:hypothetical protein